ncbi:MAG: transporter [Vicinamibacterales bacterium]
MTPFRLAAATALALLILSPVRAFAQSDSGLPELVTDRPDFTESSSVVGRGFTQLEMGTTFESNGAAGERDRTLSTPLALLRIGVSRRVELRFSTDGYVYDSLRTGFGQATTTGQADIEVGAKIVLSEGIATRGFAMAVIPMASLPTGSDAFTTGTVDPTVKFTWAKDLPKNFALSGNVNLSRLGDELGRYTEPGLSVSLGHPLVGDWSGYWEAFGFMPQGRSQAWTVNGGVTHPIGGNVQVDFELGRGVTAAAPDWFVGVGVGIRTASLLPGR